MIAITIESFPFFAKIVVALQKVQEEVMLDVQTLNVGGHTIQTPNQRYLLSGIPYPIIT